MKSTTSGKIDLNGVTPAIHEYAAYLVLANHGKTIRLICPSAKYKTSSADFEMDKLIWELKSPQGKGKYVMRDTLRQAAKQSRNIVIDLRRTKLNQEKAINQLHKHFLLEKRLSRIIIITKEQKILDIHK